MKRLCYIFPLLFYVSVVFAQYDGNRLFWDSLRLELDTNTISDYYSADHAAIIYYYSGDTLIARHFKEEALNYFLKGTYSSLDRELEYAKKLNELGVLYHETADFENAKISLLKALQIWERTIGHLHPRVAETSMNLAKLYHSMGDYSNEAAYYLKARRIVIKLWDGKFPDYATWTTEMPDFGSQIYDILHYDEFEITMSQCIRRAKTEEEKSLFMHYLGVYNSLRGNFKKAEKYLVDALQISLRKKNDIYYAMTACELGYLYLVYDKKEAKIEDLLSAAYPILKTHIRDYPDLLDLATLSLVQYYFLNQNIPYCKKYLLETLNAYCANFGEKYPHTMYWKGEIGCFYGNILEFKKAEEYISQTVALYDSIDGTYRFPRKIELTLYLAYLLCRQGEIRQAESILSTLEREVSFVFGYDHPMNALFLSIYGNIYCMSGNYESAENMFSQCLDIYDTLDEKDYRYTYILISLGRLYYLKGDYPLSMSYSQQVLAMENASPSARSIALSNLGFLYFKQGKYTLANEYYQSALKEDHNLDSLSLSYIICNEGELLHRQGKYAQAEEHYLKAEEIREKYSSISDPDYIYTLGRLGELYSQMGSLSDAKRYYSKITDICKNRFIHDAYLLTNQQRSDFWNTTDTIFNVTYPKFVFDFYGEDHSLAISAYNNELFKKGLLLNTTHLILNAIFQSDDKKLIKQWNELQELRKDVQDLKEHAPHLKILISGRENRADLFEIEITRKSAAFRENMRQWAITWDSVRAALKPNQVAIEYMRAPINKDSTMYCALLLRDTCSCPIMIPLFEEKEVSRLLHQSTTEKDSAAIRQTYTYRDHGRELTQLIWEKTMPYIREGEVVFFAPTGILHQIAIENLPFTESSTIGDNYNLVRLSSTRELAMDRPAIEHKKAVLYGDIRYSTTIEGMVVAAAKYRGTQRGYADDLPGTKKEIAAIDTILKEQQLQVQIFTSSEANEESVKALSGSKQNILHFATHGFYWQDSTGIDSMERCGLLFAGANNVLIGSPERLKDVDVNDGILTAKELSVLDFRNADIVVMSACETGLGEINGEGVFGLQRAFKMAGAKTIMMSLWQVSDDATRLLMTSFYRNLSQGMSKREAFRSAQQEVRNYTEDGASSESRGMSGKEKMLNKGKMGGGNQPSEVSRQKAEVSKPYASPYYWAGFILLD